MDEPQIQIYEFDKFRLYTAKRLLIKDADEIVPLMPKAFDTLLYLVAHAGKVLDKDQLMSEIWADTIVEENNLTQNISILRRVLGERRGEHRFIATVPGYGYKFVASVREVKDMALSEVQAVAPSSNFTELQISDANLQNKPQSVIAKNQISNLQSAIRNRMWLAAIIILVIAGLSFVGFYSWRGNVKTISDARVKSIAVLPFKPLVVENRDEALELGMADALIAKLSGGEDIVVRPLSAIRKFNAVEQDAIAVGRELNVEAVLDGSIQTWGNRIRVSAKLFRTSDGKQLWTGQFDEKFTDIFAVQDSISERVSSALKIRLAGSGKKRYPDNVEAYQLYMKGRYLLSKLTPSDIRASIPYFQQAIQIEPNYALAYTGLAQANGVLAIAGEDPAEFFPKAKAAEQKAIEIDDTLAEAHLARCMSLFWFDWDWSAAESHGRRALELNPNNAESHGNFALFLSNTGRHTEALAEAKRALELNPLDLAMNAIEGQILLHAGRPDEALAQLQKISELEPNFWMTHSFAASVYIEKGMFAAAIAESRKERELTGGNTIPFGAYALAKSGKQAEARTVLEELLKLSAGKYVSPYNIALLYNGLERRDEALTWLEKAYEQRDPKMTFLKVEPKWNNLRTEPHFIKLMQRMNFAS